MSGEVGRPAEGSILHQMMLSLQSQVSSQALAIVRLESGQERIEAQQRENIETLNAISRLLRDGNGRASLLTRVELIEQAVIRLSQSSEEVKKLIEGSRTEDTKGKWSLATTLAAGLMALFASLLTVLLTTLIGKAK